MNDSTLIYLFGIMLIGFPILRHAIYLLIENKQDKSSYKKEKGWIEIK